MLSPNLFLSFCNFASDKNNNDRDYRPRFKTCVLSGKSSNVNGCQKKQFSCRGRVFNSGRVCRLPERIWTWFPPDEMKTSMKTTKSLFGILTITAALAVQVQAQSFLTDGLVAYFPFNGNANDASGNGNNGFAENTYSTTNQFGFPNSALGFTGNSWVYVPYSASLNTTNFSVSLMFNCTGNFQDICILRSGAGESPSDFYRGYEIATVDFNSNFGMWDFDGLSDYGPGKCVTSVSQWQQSQWYNLTFTQSGTAALLYVNGVLVASATNTTPYTPAQSSPLYIGSNSAGSNNPTATPFGFFTGIIYDVRLYNRGLSSNEVAQLYAIESATVLPRLNLAISLNISGQNTNNVIGTVSTTASPKLSTLATKDLLSVLAFDKHIEGNWPSNSFPKNTTLALAGNSFIVLNGTNILLNVSDIMSFNTGEPKVTSGKQNTVNGLASPTAQGLQIAGIIFDDTFINGGKNLKFYLDGVLSKSTTDTTPVNGAYTETQTIKITTAAGDGSLRDVPFICTGSISGTGKSPLHQ
jgi:hypothetical protein